MQCYMGSYGSLFTVMLLDINKGVEYHIYFRTGVFNLLSSRANLHLSYNPAGRSHCGLQNHHGYIKHHNRGMGSSSGDVGEVPMV